jgi:hypothetical protein
MAYDDYTRPPLHIGASRIIDFPSGTSSAEFLIASTDLSVHFSLWRRLARSMKKRSSNVLSSIEMLFYCCTCSSITVATACPSMDTFINVLLVAWVKLLMSRRVSRWNIWIFITCGSLRLWGQFLSSYSSWTCGSCYYLLNSLLSRRSKPRPRLRVATWLHDLSLGVASRDHSESVPVRRRHLGVILMIRMSSSQLEAGYHFEAWTKVRLMPPVMWRLDEYHNITLFFATCLARLEKGYTIIRD